MSLPQEHGLDTNHLDPFSAQQVLALNAHTISLLQLAFLHHHRSLPPQVRSLTLICIAVCLKHCKTPPISQLLIPARLEINAILRTSRSSSHVVFAKIFSSQLSIVSSSTALIWRAWFCKFEDARGFAVLEFPENLARIQKIAWSHYSARLLRSAPCAYVDRCDDVLSG